MYQFHEDDLEQAALEWLEANGYTIVNGPEIASDGERPERDSYHDVVLTGRLQDALMKINPDAGIQAVESAAQKVEVAQSPNLLVNNRAFHKYITDGVDVEVRTPEGRNTVKKLWLFDFENPENNDFLAVNQFTVIEGTSNKRPDIIVFVNGLPLVVFELKNSTDERVGISQGFHQLQTYKKTIPSLFHFNAFMVTSDGVNARAGSLTADEERFMMWRTTDGKSIASTTVPQLEVLINGMFKPAILLDIIRHFILFQSDGEKTINNYIRFDGCTPIDKGNDNSLV